MAKNLSTGAVNFLAYQGSWASMLANGRLAIYTGTQPASADTGKGGSVTLLAKFTLANGAFTAEVMPYAIFTLTGGASGSVSSIKCAGIELLASSVGYATSLNNTASLIAASINMAGFKTGFSASVSGAAVTIYAPKGSGTRYNGLAMTDTKATLTATWNAGSSTTMGGTGGRAGVEAVNGLNFAYPPASGVLSKESSDWSCDAVATGQAGWFRFYGSPDDPELLNDSSTDCSAINGWFIRYDGRIATSGGDMTVASTQITSGTRQTINTFALTIPMAQ